MWPLLGVLGCGSGITEGTTIAALPACVGRGAGGKGWACGPVLGLRHQVCGVNLNYLAAYLPAYLGAYLGAY
jgi:hypothetical protein